MSLLAPNSVLAKFIIILRRKLHLLF